MLCTNRWCLHACIDHLFRTTIHRLYDAVYGCLRVYIETITGKALQVKLSDHWQQKIMIKYEFLLLSPNLVA